MGGTCMAAPRFVILCFGCLLHTATCGRAPKTPCVAGATGTVPRNCSDVSLIQHKSALSRTIRREGAAGAGGGVLFTPSQFGGVLFAPSQSDAQVTKETLTHWASILFLFLLKVFIAGSVDIMDVPARCRRKTGIVLGVACQFVILPFCGFCTAKLLKLEPFQGLSLMIMMTSPGGSFSNWWCSLFNADLAMSVVMTIVSALVGVVMLPINVSVYSMLLYGRGHSFTGEQFMSVLQCFGIILAAMALGLLASRHWRSEAQRDAFNCAANGMGLLLFLLGLFISKSAQRPFWRQPLYIHAATALPILGAMAVSTSLTRMDFFKLTKPERVSVVVEVCYQNPGLALSIVIVMFNAADSAEAVAVPILYGVYEAVFIGAFCLVAHYVNWTLADPKEVSLVRAMHGNFQGRAARIVAAERDTSRPTTFSVCETPIATPSSIL